MLKTPSPLQSRGSPPTGALQPPVGAGAGSSPAFRWIFFRSWLMSPVLFHMIPESCTAITTSGGRDSVRGGTTDTRFGQSKRITERDDTGCGSSGLQRKKEEEAPDAPRWHAEVRLGYGRPHHEGGREWLGAHRLSTPTTWRRA